MVELASAKKVSGARREVVPFPAIVGQAGMKEALLAVGANESLDGLLIRGEKGTAKSTAARALADLLPEQRAVADCPYGCPPDDSAEQCGECADRTDPPVEARAAPFVTLPLGAARERVVGSLSVASALDGEAQFNPGLLARANRGILYVDEVNLLDDHLVDVLLDAAASGRNRVEQDGVSVTHPAECTLVGTMNPEEGDLRPQFRDRFDLQVAVAGADDLDTRVEVVERAVSGFDDDYATETAAVRDRLHEARERLPDVTTPDSLVREAAELCRDAGVEGHRADIATVRAARTLAALDGRERVIESDLRRGGELALPHRVTSRPFEDSPDPSEVVDDHFDGDDGDDAGDGSENAEASENPETAGESAGDDESANSGAKPDGTDRPGDGTGGDGGNDQDDGRERGDSDRAESRDGDDAPETSAERDETRKTSAETDEPQESAEADGPFGEPSGDESGSETDSADEEATPAIPGSRSESVAPRGGRSPEMETPTAETVGDGRRAAEPGTEGRGGRIRTERASGDDAVDAAASVRAAAKRGSDRVTARDLRKSVRAGSAASLVVFAIDASASMRGPMRAAKGVALDLLRDAYQRRDEVAVVTFAGERADVVLPPTDSVERAARHLKSLPTGDRTPLPAGLDATAEVLARADPDSAVVVLVTDGRANAGSTSPVADTREAAGALREQGANVLVVDAGETDDRSSLVPDLVAAADGERVPLEALTPERVANGLAGGAGGQR